MIFLAIQNTYTNLTIALMNGSTIIDSRSCDKKEATGSFIPLLDDLLTTHNLTLSSCAFIAVNYGPGPFTTLRVVISSVNGLSFTHQIPLIGIDALEAMAYEYNDPQYPNTIIMLNAFGGDAYYGIIINNKLHECGALSPEKIIKKIEHINGVIRFIGNGVPLYKETIMALRPDAHIPNPLPEYCSIATIGICGLTQFERQSQPTYQLMPRYIKKGLGEI